ncbi:MAG: dNTP triphosphohydrolase [Bacteroidales bacterium]|nr:dNTP triphosphohydrolase [Porphyromonas sp.]MDD6934827.1 dNTP triphosphohydrolase [Bacteroidales bacterium]MDY3102191.1 dNTP triphosphohydrolase [Porphyromonas sp.]
MAQMNWQTLLSDKRFDRKESISPSLRKRGRNEFERDYDRMVFSAPFRRLQNKAQIFPLPGNVFVHNRLTHSLEVSCVGRSLGNIVAHGLLDRYEDLPFAASDVASIVSAACLAHDMGNPPFGHSGERAISAYFREGAGRVWEEVVRREGDRWEDFIQFEGNANAFRLLTHRFEGRRPGGFALTYSTLASVVKYPYSSLSAHGKGKFGYFATEEDTFHEIASHLGILKLQDSPSVYARYPLVFLVEAADDICYQIMDLEDAYKLRILSFDEVAHFFESILDEEEKVEVREVLFTIEDCNERVAYLRSKVINHLTEACAQAFLDHEKEISCGTLSSPLVSLIPSAKSYQSISRYAYQHIYTNRDVVDVELAGHRIFSEIIEKMMYALMHPDNAYSHTFLNRVSSQYNIREESTYGKIQCTLDYLSGMTDLYALDLYRKITGMNLPFA